MLSVFGVYIFLEIFKKNFGNTSAVLNNICGSNAANTQTSCSKIINSDKINIFGLKISDFGLVYFIGFSILGLFLPNTDFTLAIFSFVSILVVLYSLYNQVFVEKAICKICLLIISILLLQISISICFLNSNFSTIILVLSLLCFSIVLFSLIYINDILKKKEDLQKSNVKNLRFKRNYEIFKRELLTKEKITFENNKNGFFFGNPDAKLHISLVTNPYCGFCKDAHHILENLLEKYTEDLSAQIRFNYISANENKKLKQLIGSLKNIYVSKEQTEFLQSIHFWFDKRDEKIFHEKYSISNPTSLAELEKAGNKNANKGLNFTPIFLINGYRFPDKYDREDIFYFIDELLEDLDVINEN